MSNIIKINYLMVDNIIPFDIKKVNWLSKNKEIGYIVTERGCVSFKTSEGFSDLIPHTLKIDLDKYIFYEKYSHCEGIQDLDNHYYSPKESHMGNGYKAKLLLCFERINKKNDKFCFSKEYIASIELSNGIILYTIPSSYGYKMTKRKPKLSLLEYYRSVNWRLEFTEWLRHAIIKI